MNSGQILLSVHNLSKYFPVKRGFFSRRQVTDIKAVDDVSFDLFCGETLGLVGESGCGKSTLGRTILQLYQPTAGQVIFDQTDITKVRREELRKLRRRMQMIFQDPYASLDSRWTITSIIREPMRAHSLYTSKEQLKKVAELLELVQLSPFYMNRYPHEFSGGQRQRISIARALASNPDLIICDEPISSLDVSIQAQVVNLLDELQDQLMLTYLFITHDLSMVRHICDRVAVMYLGSLVEMADQDDLYNLPAHPYTQALLSAVPIPDPHKTRSRKRIILEGDPPSSFDFPSGCRFHPRCWLAQEICSQKVPSWREIQNNHWIACHLA